MLQGFKSVNFVTVTRNINKTEGISTKNHLEVDKFKYLFCWGAGVFFFFFGNTNPPFMVDVVGLLLGDGLAEEPPGRCLCCFSSKLNQHLVDIL